MIRGSGLRNADEAEPRREVHDHAKEHPPHGHDGSGLRRADSNDGKSYVCFHRFIHSGIPNLNIGYMKIFRIRANSN